VLREHSDVHVFIFLQVVKSHAGQFLIMMVNLTLNVHLGVIMMPMIIL